MESVQSGVRSRDPTKAVLLDASGQPVAKLSDCKQKGAGKLELQAILSLFVVRALANTVWLPEDCSYFNLQVTG